FAVQLVSKDGKKTRTLELKPTDRKPTYGEWPRSESRLLDDNLGYLRLARMDNTAVQEVYRWMPRFRETNGLIVDVRGNGGGSREALLALAGFLLGDKESPWVGNFAVYRKSSKFDEDHLAKRFMRRLDSAEWTPEQRSAIDRAFATFKPEWQTPDGFSKWHALVLDRTGHPQEFPYTKEVVILSDAGCFSATDIFLGALEIHPRVTLMGTPSSGGSARSQRFTLDLSLIEVKCASMASFRPNGWLYDGRGIEVDIEVHPDPTFFINGGRDKALERAIERLKKR
ncbi:MAG: S41 family peptidase, partial [Planctomycetota bacterium]